MIRSFKITNHLGDELVLDLFHPELSGFLIESVDGLGPVHANITMTAIANGDGSLFTSARAETRNIVMRLRFLENSTIGMTRRLTYKYFPLKRPVNIEITTDNEVRYCDGYIESNEPNIFSDSEGCQISILCPDPYFYAPSFTTQVFYGVESLFHFPFANNSTSENLIVFSEIRGQNTENIVYNGDVETGFICTVHAIGPATMVTLYDLSSQEQFKINTDILMLLVPGGLLGGDDIIISTVPGDKYVRHMRNGFLTNIINAIDKTSDWATLSKGDNLFAYDAATGRDNIYLYIQVREAYAGI